MVDVLTDVITELTNEGIDTIQTGITYTLVALANVENLSLTGIATINGTGNTANNVLVGNSAANNLSADSGNDTLEGGLGNDTLIGGAGIDTAIFRGTRTQYTLTSIPTGWTLTGTDGIDTLSEIEFAQFSDMTLSLGNFAPSGQVTITGVATVGQTLTASNTLADVDGLGALSYQWQANGIAISGATTNTYVLTGSYVGKTITALASYTDGHGTKETVVSNSISLGTNVALLAYTWNTHTLLNGVNVSGASQSATTNSSGEATWSAVAGTSENLTANRTVPSAETAKTSAAVNLQDAIAILKMIVGLPVNGANQPVSPYQTLAADFDANGTVGLTDAIGVLKHVVGLPAPEPAWHFVSETDPGVPSMTTLSPGTPHATVTADLTGPSPVHVGLVGYLSGDVDGSYAGAAGALDLDVTQPTYIATLVANHPGLTVAQFGG